MIHALMLSFQSLSDQRVVRLLAKVILWTFVAVAIFGVGVWFALHQLFLWLELGDGGFWSGLLSLAIIMLSGILLFRAIAVAITWVFADDIIDAVEDRHYPEHAKTGVRPNFAKGLQMGMRSVIRVIAYNMLALPLYILLLVTGVGTAIAFLLINAFLMGRDLEDMLVARHGKDRGSIRKLPRMLLGLLATAAMMIPFVNFFVPVLATATAVHMVHSGVRNA